MAIMTASLDHLQPAEESLMEPIILNVLSWRLGEATAALEKLAKKARRYGCPDITWEIGETTLVKRQSTDWDGETRVVETCYTELRVSGSPPVAGPYELLAHVELHEGGNLVDVVPGTKDLDQRFWNSDGFCNHCNSRRDRKDVYVVRHTETGEQLQVGRACLKDFLGVDPAHVARRFEFFRGVDQLQDSGLGKPDWGQSLDGLLVLSARCIRLFGWCSRAQAAQTLANSTSYYVMLVLRTYYTLSDEEQKLVDKIRASADVRDDDMAAETKAWVLNELPATSEYAHNLKVLFKSDFVHDPKRVGIIVSAVGSYQRELAKRIERHAEQQAASASEYLGAVGQRLRDVEVTLRSQRVIGSNEWGDRVLVKFADAAGNLLTWITSSGTGLEVGERCLLTGTVKAHNEYHGARETLVARCKLADVQEAAA